MYFLPLLPISREWQVAILVASLLSAHIIHNAINSPKINWCMSLIDEHKRGRFTANKEIVSLLSGMLALGTTYLISGIGSQYFLQDLRRNTFFALIQFASVWFLYFAFSATVDWKKFNVDYLAWSGLVAGLVVLAELVRLYYTQDIWVDGVIFRGALYTGWGTYNNMGAIIVTAIPFAFYLAQKKKQCSMPISN